METYDENLGENSFFVALQEECFDLYNTVTTNRWTVCVPKAASVRSFAWTEEDFLNHVLIHTSGTTYKTLSDKELCIKGSCITTGAGFREPRTVLILFEETYFNANEESYQVLCLNQCLEGGVTHELSIAEAPALVIHSLEDCKQLLWRGAEESRMQRHLDDLINLFSRTCPRLETESQRHLVDAANALFTRSMQTVLKDSHLRKSVKESPAYMENVKVAVETYVMHGVYRRLFKNIMVYTALRDANLNKITRNLAHLQLRDLGVRPEFCNNVPRARRELANLKRYSTPLGKLNCIRRVVLRLQHTASSKNDGARLPLTTDDLLPILVFLVVKAEMPNWWAHFTYMTSFRFAKASNDDEYGFYLASLEAALEHVSSGQLNSLELGAENPQRVQLSMSTDTGSIWQRQDSSDSQTNLLFQYIKEGDIERIRKLLSGRPKARLLSDIQTELCHPLCSCEKCGVKVAELEPDPNTATLYSRDDRGHTVLHAAAMSGRTDMTDFLIREGAVINSTDYHGHSPLHVACQKGHQGVTLLFLHYDSDINLQDNDGCSPLHLATANGHEDCVKALLYYDHGSTVVDINIANDFGDTPLHMAARWGYETLVELLLENGASVQVRNRKKQLPLDCAHNIKVARRLAQASEQQKEGTGHWRRNSQPNIGLKRSASMPATGSVADISTMAAVTPTPAQAVERVPAAKRPTPQLTEFERRVEKLLKAVRDGDIQMAKFHLGWTEDNLVEQGEDIDVTQGTLCHPLCQCPKCFPLQQFSISQTGVFVNNSNHEGLTPLHVAALHGRVSLVELFCKRGANVNAKTLGDDYSSLHLACQNTLSHAEQVVSLLVQHGAKVNQRDGRGCTPLHYCCLNRIKAAARTLLKNGCKVNLANQKGNTALHEAAHWNAPGISSLLLQHNASVNVRNRKQQTPLHLAQSDKTLRLLLEASTGHGSFPVPRGSRSRSKTSRSMSTDSVMSVEAVGQRGVSSTQGESEGRSKKVSMRELFAAFEDKELQRLKQLAQSIQRFDRRRSLRHIVTRDRSAPRLDQQLACQLSIRHFDTSKLRPTSTNEKRALVVVVTENCESEESRQKVKDLTEIQPWSAVLVRQTLHPDVPLRKSLEREASVKSTNSSASDDSDIFIREKKYSVFKPVDPARPGEASGSWEGASYCQDCTADQEASDTADDPDLFMQEMECLHKDLECGSDAEADVFFRVKEDRPMDDLNKDDRPMDDLNKDDHPIGDLYKDDRPMDDLNKEEGIKGRTKVDGPSPVLDLRTPTLLLSEAIGEWLVTSGRGQVKGRDVHTHNLEKNPYGRTIESKTRPEDRMTGTDDTEDQRMTRDLVSILDEPCTSPATSETCSPLISASEEASQGVPWSEEPSFSEEYWALGHSTLSSEACTPDDLLSPSPLEEEEEEYTKGGESLAVLGGTVPATGTQS